MDWRDKRMGKILVAYFSASGTTAKLAANLASAINADLHEIQPQSCIQERIWIGPTERAGAVWK